MRNPFSLAAEWVLRTLFNERSLTEARAQDPVARGRARQRRRKAVSHGKLMRSRSHARREWPVYR